MACGDYILSFNKPLKSTALSFDIFYKKREYTDLRLLKIILLSDILGNCDEYLNLSYDDKMSILQTIENSCLNETIRKAREYNVRCSWDNKAFVQVYHAVCYNLFPNIDLSSDTGSHTLIRKIFNKEIDINSIACLPSKELCPEKYNDMIDNINKRSNTGYEEKYTELYYCRKCKKNKSRAERVQNRSNDEGSSFKITCLFCGNRWFGG